MIDSDMIPANDRFEEHDPESAFVFRLDETRLPEPIFREESKEEEESE